MTFPTLQGRSDPRVLCGIMANQFLKELTVAPTRPDTSVSICLVNLMRLVDMYRHAVMRSIPEPIGILQREQADVHDWTSPEQDPLQDLEKAMEAAQREVFGADSSREDAATRVRNVLRLRLDGKLAADHEYQQTQRFFQVLLAQLRVQP